MAFRDNLTTTELNSRSDTCFDMLVRSAIDSGLQSPVNSVIQIINRGIGSEYIPPLQIVERPLEAQAGSVEWYCQQLGTGIGVVADLAALRAAGRGLGSRLGMEKAGLKIGLLRVEQGALESTLVGKAAGAFTLGAAYEGIFRPVHSGEEHEFWSARFKNGLAGGATLASLDLSLRALNPLASKAISNEANFALRSARNLAVGSVGGFGAGVTNAAVRSALSDWEFRTSDLLTSGAQYAVAGSVFRTPFLLNPVQKTSLNPERELRATMELATAAGAGEKFSQQLSEFQQRAANQGLSMQEVARTYAAIGSFMRSDSSVGIGRAELNALSLQCLKNAAAPYTIDQGINNTCNVTTVEGRLYTVSPSDAISVVSKIALDGKFRTRGGSLITLDTLQLQPDDEAKSTLLTMDSGKRLYASQLFQHGAINTYWQTARYTPDLREVPKGSLEYRVQNSKGAEGTNPAMPRQEQIVDRSSGESVVLRFQGELINSPKLTLEKMLQVERALTGRLERSRMVDGAIPASTKDIMRPHSAEELKEHLKRTKADKGFPITLQMDVRAEAFWQPNFGDRPVVVNSFRDNFCHVLQIVDFDEANNKVYIDGSWGVEKDFLDKPNGKPALTLEQTFTLIQDHASKVSHLMVSHNKEFSEDAVRVVQSWTNLRTAHLGDTNITDKSIVNFQGNAELTFLDVSGCKITNEGFSSLNKLVKLEQISLNRTQVTKDILPQLGNYPNLRELDVSGTTITPADIAAAADKLRNLKFVCLSAHMLTPQALTELNTKIPGIQVGFRLDSGKDHAYIWTNHASGDRTRVDSVAVDSAPAGEVTRNWLHSLKNLPELKTVYISRTKLAEADLAKLNALSTIDNLQLPDCDVTDGVITHLSALTRLKSLVLPKTKTTGAMVEQFTQLEHLNLADTKANDEGLKNIDRLTRLFSIDLSDTQITDASTHKLSRLPALRYLNLAGTSVSDAGVRQLPLRLLVQLNLADTKITDSSMPTLAASQVESLNLDDTAVTSAGISKLKTSTNLTKLSAQGLNCSVAAASDLASIPTLTELILSKATISDAEVEKLSASRSLQSLNLAQTNVSDRSVASLLRMRTHSLDLQGTKVTADGIKRLVSSHPSLKSLTVSDDMCTDAERIELLRTHPAVQVVRVHKPVVAPVIAR